MRFFNVKAVTSNDVNGIYGLYDPKEGKDVRKEQRANKKIAKIADELNKKTCDALGCAFFSEEGDLTMPSEIAVAIINDGNPEKLAVNLLKATNINYESLKFEEITVRDFLDKASDAEDKSLLYDENELISRLGLITFNSYPMRHSRGWRDVIADDNKSIKTLYKEAKSEELGSKYIEELDRITKSPRTKKYAGQAVHYIISSKDGGVRRNIVRGLVSALYDRGRLTSKRYTIISADEEYFPEMLKNIYDISEGACVLIKVPENGLDGGSYKRNAVDLDELVRTVKSNAHKTLTMFSMDFCSEKIKNKLLNALAGLAVVEINEDSFFKQTAVDALKRIAGKDGATLGDELIEKFSKSDKNYTYSELAERYGAWRHENLATEVYPQYKPFFTRENEVEKTESDAYVELERMIGLNAVKKVINDVVGYYKLQKEFRLRGLDFSRPSMHMAFTGSPGTAKTTVARLLARIFKDNGILSVGNLIETGRADIVAKYVGHTAPKVKDLFDKAKGSVLFIDEAYSLVDGNEGLYGDEAINQIVQEMENRREDVLVIFAGYTDEMETFLSRNPGLNSRIAFKVPFDDYTEEELFEIAEQIAQKTGYSIESGAKDKLITRFRAARSVKGFGNGRYARSVVERAALKQSGRIFKIGVDSVSNATLTTLTAEDFVFENLPAPPRKIGF